MHDLLVTSRFFFLKVGKTSSKCHITAGGFLDLSKKIFILSLIQLCLFLDSHVLKQMIDLKFGKCLNIHITVVAIGWYQKFDFVAAYAFAYADSTENCLQSVALLFS